MKVGECVASSDRERTDVMTSPSQPRASRLELFLASLVEYPFLHLSVTAVAGDRSSLLATSDSGSRPQQAAGKAVGAALQASSSGIVPPLGSKQQAMGLGAAARAAATPALSPAAVEAIALLHSTGCTVTSGESEALQQPRPAQKMPTLVQHGDLSDYSEGQALLDLERCVHHLAKRAPCTVKTPPHTHKCKDGDGCMRAHSHTALHRNLGDDWQRLRDPVQQACDRCSCAS
jgi:hypothetical protein